MKTFLVYVYAVAFVATAVCGQTAPAGTKASGAETITGAWTFTTAPTVNATSDREWSPLTYDLDVGDGVDEGQARFGSFVLGTANDTISGTVLDDVTILYNAVDTALDVSFVLVDASTNTPRLVIAEEGADMALHNPRSLKIGPAASWATLAAGTLCSTDFDAIDCDTGGTGADLGVQDDIELGGSIFGDGGDGDAFYIALNFASATAIRNYMFTDSGGDVCTDTNGECTLVTGVGHLYERDLDGTPANSIAITTGGTYYGWTTATAGVAEGGLVLDVANVTADSITVDDAGSYVIAWSVGASGSAGVTIICCAHVEGSIPAAGPCMPRKLGTPSGDVGSFGASAPVTLAASDEVDLRCTTLTGEDSKTIDLWEVHLWVREVNI